jgi:hypothetical protein
MKQLGVGIGIHAVGIFVAAARAVTRDARTWGRCLFHVRVPALIMHGSEGGDCSITSRGGAGL